MSYRPTPFAEFTDSDLLNHAIEAHYAEMTDMISRKGHSRSFAREIIHDLYVKLASRPNVLRDKRSIQAFLVRSAINLGIDQIRRQKRENYIFSGTEGEALGVACDKPAPDFRLQVDSRISILHKAIGELPPRRRAVFILNRLHNLSADEIAQKLGISKNMVDRHLRYALTHCLDRLFQFG